MNIQLIQIVAIIFSLGIFVGIVDLIRRRMLKEQYAILWLISAIVLLILSVWRQLLDRIAFVFLLLIVLHFSVIISNISEKNKRLSQEIAILKTMFEQYAKGEKNEYR